MNVSSHLISIVIPVYNGERYLSYAIDSILAQSYDNWELMVVDDGSTDSTASICDDYAAKDSRIRVFHQSNGGVNVARAKGIDNISGEYLTFLDADDTFSYDALAEMLKEFSEGIDIVSCGNISEIFDQAGFLNALWNGLIAPGICTKMYRTALFNKIDYKLDRRLAMGEDLLLNSMCSLGMNKAVVIPRSLYIINKDNEASVTKNFKHNWEYEKYYFNKVNEFFLSQLKQSDIYPQIELLVYKSWLNAMKYSILDGGGINYNDPEYKAIHDYYNSRRDQLGPSEKLLFVVKNPWMYRMILKTYMSLKGARK